jgi:hypothetical protein
MICFLLSRHICGFLVEVAESKCLYVVILDYRQPSLYAISLYAFSLQHDLGKKKPWENCTVTLQSPCTVVAWLCGARTSWSHLTSISVRGSVELANPVDVERSSFIFKAMGKRSRPNCDKNGCKFKKQRKAITLEEKISVIHFTRFRVTRWFLGTNLSRNTRVCCSEFVSRVNNFGVIINEFLGSEQIYNCIPFSHFSVSGLYTTQWQWHYKYEYTACYYTVCCPYRFLEHSNFIS